MSRQHAPKRLVGLWLPAMALILSFLGVSVTHAAPVPSMTLNDFYATNNIFFYSDNACLSSLVSSIPGSTSTSGSDISFAIPATSGKAGLEEAVLENGALISNPSGPKVTFSGFAALGQEYRDYYITMRWGYVAWYWNGKSATTDGGPAYLAWMREAPRIVKVTNPDNGKSIYAAAIEAGPAPWTGVDTYSNNDPKQGWSNPQVGTPSGYTGRVSGFPPVAFDYLEIKQGMYNGTGTVLTYEWAADQSVKPGPTDGSGGSGGC
ncbi:hypothetical protein FWG95_00565 [Candidatus Saccharibacteria bacterium]|nr:hypothetical protein [Candidatus Saccharibacteria bacterium]